ncbi:SDR family NAD(P)-dependent oxidoreductase [Rivularia sp. UHCC 0363]|uniref:SDR family NAD(P)-dependent oxidoreductase n=1 Tax=Rivularia sp. UHCC 0363 TaxID=3110244 RepID=UPI002B2131BB|nr:SDR family oxidoreductase [Rivularia sp. UHCC 0363]MEA5598431.1 SDR family oxidoreductase [Rivularia sp. UHCC 0363]
MNRRDFVSKTVSASVITSVASQKKSDDSQTNRKRFEDKVVIITGATSGIGKAAAFAFAKEGAKVGFCGRRENLGQQVQEDIKNQGGEATYIKADVIKADELKIFIDSIVNKYKRLDIAFNNAGTVMFRNLHEIEIEEWDNMFNTNTRGVFLAMKYQIPHMLKTGGGSIVITSSMHQVSTRPGGSAYAASKNALMGIARAAAMDYGEKGIRVNLLAPGITDTPMFRNATGGTPEAIERAKSIIDSLKRIATPEEIAEVALFLASDESRYITGTSILADGGMMAG